MRDIMANGQSNPTNVNATKSSVDPSPQIAPQTIITILTKKYKIQIIFSISISLNYNKTFYYKIIFLSIMQ